MDAKVYELNKNLNKPLTFFGLSSRWIKYAAVILLINFLVIAICLAIKLPTVVVIGIILFGIVIPIYYLRIANKKYGENGFEKYLASRSVPAKIKSGGRLETMLNAEEKTPGHHPDLFS